MSKENVKLFFEKMQKDAGLQEKVKGLHAENQEKMEEGLVKLGAENGYDFSKEEMQQLAHETSIALQESGELDDSQLEAVSGGVVGWVVGTVIATLIGTAAAATVGTGVGVAFKVLGDD